MTGSVKELQTKGNALYGDGRYEAARACYSQALELIASGGDLLAIAPSESTAADAWKAVTASQLLSNRAQTAIQERDFAAALRDAAQALKYDAHNEKALLRKLIALENLERFEAAFRQVESILDGGEKGAPTLFQYCVTARRRLRKNLAKDREVAASEVEQMGKMVHGNQQLRINFGCLVPSQVPLGQFFDVNVNIGNEFGLFQRDYVKSGEHIYLQCSLRNNPGGRYKLVFEAPSTESDSDDTGEGDASGKLTLNYRGKAAFRVAIVVADDAKPDGEASEVPLGVMAIQIHAHEASKATWNLFPVVSLPFTLVPSDSELLEGCTGDLGVHCCRAVAMDGLEHDIILAESPGNLGIGGKLWDSCLVLTRYLAARKELLVDKQVVELGSGLGLVGIFCAMLGARVTLTDMAEVVPLLEYNIALNFPAPTQSGAETVPAGVNHPVRPVARAHLWGEPPANLPAHVDVLVLSDVVYDPEGYAPLVASLEALATSPETLILMAHRSRNPMEPQFFALLARNFSCEQIDWLPAGNSDRVAQETADTPASSGERALEDVKIFTIRRLAAQ